MGIRFIEGVVLYCSTDGVAFGPVFQDTDTAQAFLQWLPTDAPKYGAAELAAAGQEFIAAYGNGEKSRIATVEKSGKAWSAWLAWVVDRVVIGPSRGPMPGEPLVSFVGARCSFNTDKSRITIEMPENPPEWLTPELLRDLEAASEAAL